MDASQKGPPKEYDAIYDNWEAVFLSPQLKKPLILYWAIFIFCL